MSEAEKATTALIELMARLRDPLTGCPWDREQTFASVAPYTIEEAYEVADAIDGGSPQKLRDELGDLLFQVVFHARMAQERGWFDFAAVAQGIHDKLVRRHPHVFGGETLSGSQHTRSWEDLKAQERAQAARSGLNPDAGTLADVPKSLPALARAAKLGRRASRVGFDWDSAPGVRDKVLEELREVDDAVSGTELVREGAAETEGAAVADIPIADARVAEARVAEEIGDLLFSVANWARHLRLDPEEALRKANAKFEMRFRRMEALAATRGTALDTLKPADWEALWSEAKRAAESV